MHSWNLKDRRRIELQRLLQQAQRRYAAMTSAQRKSHDDAQRASLVRGMTTPCEHGVLDFEQCAQCRPLRYTTTRPGDQDG